jgi:endogenous inhibitor of DNA gyrase (YacG/DUF329 family)
MADLGRWLSEDYRVPDDPSVSPFPSDDDDGAPSENLGAKDDDTTS